MGMPKHVSVTLVSCIGATTLSMSNQNIRREDLIHKYCRHPVKLPQILYETIWNTSAFIDQSMWPADGSQPFVFSTGDRTGYSWHGDYMFGWKGDSLQRAMDKFCGVDCPKLKTQSVEKANECSKPKVVDETVDGWLSSLPGGMPITP
jgi:hypothetical protein